MYFDKHIYNQYLILNSLISIKIDKITDNLNWRE